MQMPNLEVNQNMLTPQPWGHLHGGAHVGYNPQYMHPQPRIDVYYAPPGADQLSFYNQHQGPLVYGRQASMGSHLSNVQAIQSVATQVHSSCFNLSFLSELGETCINCWANTQVPENKTIFLWTLFL